MKKLLVFSLILTSILFSCSKDDKEDEIITESNSESPTEISAEQEVSTFEIVTIEIENTSLSDTYQGTFAGEKITLTKIDENTLGFFVSNLPSGTYSLDFELANLDFNVTETTLKQTSDEVIESFKNKVENSFVTTDDQSSSKGTSILENILANASEEELEAIALYFEANEETFNDIINLNSLSNKSLYEKLTTESNSLKTNVGKVALGVAAIALGNEIVVGGIATGGLVSVGGAVIGGAGAALVYDTFPQLKNNFLSILDIAFATTDFDSSLDNGLSGKSAKTASLSVISTEASTFYLNQNNRTLNTSDSSSDDIVVQAVFETYDAFISIVDKMNEAIDIVNEVPFISFDKITSLSIPDVPKVEAIDVTAEEFSNYSFSTNNSLIGISTSYLSTGKFELTLTADDSLDLSEGIETQIIITYSDDFTEEITSYIDVTLEGEDINPLVGNWTAISYNGKAMGEVFNSNYSDKCGVYLSSEATNSSSFDISDSNILLSFNSNIYSSDYSSSDTGEIDCESISKTYEGGSASLSFMLSEFEKNEETNIYERVTNFDDGQVNTLSIELLTENQMRFINKHKDIDEITRTAYTIIYNKE